MSSIICEKYQFYNLLYCMSLTSVSLFQPARPRSHNSRPLQKPFHSVAARLLSYCLFSLIHQDNSDYPGVCLRLLTPALYHCGNPHLSALLSVSYIDSIASYHQYWCLIRLVLWSPFDGFWVETLFILQAQHWRKPRPLIPRDKIYTLGFSSAGFLHISSAVEHWASQ